MKREDAIKAAQTSAADCAENVIRSGALKLTLDTTREDLTLFSNAFALELADQMNLREGRSNSVTRTAVLTAYQRQFIDVAWKRLSEVPEVIAARRAENLKWVFESAIKNAETTLAKFKESLSRDAVHAFEWCDSAMEASAVLAVFTRCREALTTSTLAEVRANVLARVLQMSESPSRSTSTPSNMMTQNTLSAYSVFLRETKYFDTETPDRGSRS